MKNVIRTALSVLLVVSLVFVFYGCKKDTVYTGTDSDVTTTAKAGVSSEETDEQKTTDNKKTTDEQSQNKPVESENDSDKTTEYKTSTEKDDQTEENYMSNPRVKVTMENGGEFIIELYPEYAPKTVENFLKLVNNGFYDGLTFHRVVDNFMCQGGDPEGNGMGGSAEKIYGEFSTNGWPQNTLSHTRGVISMARSQENNSASSQFFICYSDYCRALDGSYAAFGKVTEGMEVCDAFCAVARTYNSMGEKASPIEPIYIKSMEEIK